MSSEASTAPVAEMAAVTGGRNAISIPPAERGGAWGKAGFGWAVFEFARNPYYLLVVIYIFAPYFARDVIGANLLASGELAGIDPELARQTANASGQAFIASITKYAGFAAGLTAPLLGAALDRGGRRKPVLAFLLAVMAASSFMLWFGQPGDAGLPIGTIAIFLVIAGVCYAYSEVIHNSMLSDSGRPEVLSSISGNGLALGNLAGTGIMLALVLMFALPAAVGWPFERALFGLDVADYEHFRLAGPLSAVWLVVFIIPFFMFVPDAGRKGASWSKAVVSGTRGLLGTLSRAREHKEILKFLFARMIYADAMLALLALGGVYVGLFFDWNFMELIVYAIWMSIFATAGGFLGGTLDRVFGTKNALILEISVMTFILFTMLSITPASLFFGLIDSYQVWDGPIYQGLHDWAYLGVAAGLAVSATASISSSRSMLVGMAPKAMIGEFFGLYAIAGTVTVWIGPLMVQIFTDLFNSQRIGMASIGGLFLIGLAALCFVRHPKGTVVP